MKRLVIPLLLMALVCAIYGRTFSHDFVMWDDDVNVYANPHFLAPGMPNIAVFWREVYMSLYVPLTHTVWGFLAWLARSIYGRIAAPPFHVTNVLVHALASIFTFLLLRSLLDGLRTGSGGEARDSAAQVGWAAAFGATIFAVHPIQVEPVAWVTGLKDVLCGALSMLCLLQFVLAARGGATRRRAILAGTATLSLVLALLAKPMAVVVPCMALVLVYAGRTARDGVGQGAVDARTDRRFPVALALGWLLLAIPWMLLTRRAQPADTVESVVPLWGRPLIAGDALLFYVYKLLAPLFLGPDYGRDPRQILATPWIWITGLTALGAAVWLWRHRSRPIPVLSAGLFVAGLLPVLGIVPFRFQRYATVADRYMYIAMLGPAFLGAALFLTARKHRRIRGLLIACVAILAARAFVQAGVWENSRTFLLHGIRMNPDSYELRVNLGNVLASAGRADDALAQYRAALRVDPDNPDAIINIGNIFRSRTRYDEAAKHYFTALRMKPDYAEAHYNLGLVFGQQNKKQVAATHYSQALMIQPDYAEPNNNLGLLFAEQGRYDEAFAHYSRAVASNPYYVDAYNNLAVALSARGDVDAALRNYSRALAIQPHHKETHNNLGVLLAAQGRMGEALFHYSEVLRANPKLAAARINLANALSQTKATKEAAQHYRIALQLEPASPEAHFNYGLLLLKSGNLDDAITEFAGAAQLRPGFTQAEHNLALARALRAKRAAAPREAIRNDVSKP